MISITRVKQATKDFIKILRFGKKDVQTSEQALPYGVDSKPIKNEQAVQSTTQNDESTVILGYLLKSEETKSGEIRLYSTDDNGNVKYEFILKKDGTLQFNKGIDNAVKYIPLDAGLQAMVTKINVELGKIATAITTLGGTYAILPIGLDISNSKVNDVNI